MKKEYIVKCLTRLREFQEKYTQLKNIGIDVNEYSNPLVDLLEESICYLVSATDKAFEENLELVQWWLYDQPNKIFYYKDKPDLDVNKAEDFADFLVNQNPNL